MADFSFHHGGVSVPDMAAAIAWYGEVLGFALEREFVIAPARTSVAMLRKGDMRIELFVPEDGHALPADRREPRLDIRTHGNKHIAFQMDNLDAFLIEMEAKGADVAFIVREGFGRGCFIRDCAGNLIEFVEESAA